MFLCSCLNMGLLQRKLNLVLYLQTLLFCVSSVMGLLRPLPSQKHNLLDRTVLLPSTCLIKYYFVENRSLQGVSSFETLVLRFTTHAFHPFSPPGKCSFVCVPTLFRILRLSLKRSCSSVLGKPVIFNQFLSYSRGLRARGLGELGRVLGAVWIRTEESQPHGARQAEERRQGLRHLPGDEVLPRHQLQETATRHVRAPAQRYARGFPCDSFWRHELCIFTFDSPSQ